MVWCMRDLQARTLIDGNYGIEALGYRAEVQRIPSTTIRAKDSRPHEGGTAEVAVDGAVFMWVSAD